MKKTIKLPAPELSQLKVVDIDLDMTGRHYATLATTEGRVPEDVALSILKDLVEQDASKLTLSELRYLFMLVKINALDNNYKVNVKCTLMHKGKPCNCVNEFVGRLSDADLNRTPHNYKVPELSFVINDSQKTYKIMPPTMDMESALLNYFVDDLGHSLKDIEEDKTVAMQFTYIRSVMHLFDEKENKFIIDHPNQFATVEETMDLNKYQTVSKLYEFSNEVDSFGVQSDKLYELKCKECGGTLRFRLPLLHGLVD